MLFYFLGKKEKCEYSNKRVFECGFTPYHYTRISISIHYYIIGIVFLFLDLELCFIIPFFTEPNTRRVRESLILMFFITILLSTLIYE